MREGIEIGFGFSTRKIWSARGGQDKRWNLPFPLTCLTHSRVASEPSGARPYTTPWPFSQRAPACHWSVHARVGQSACLSGSGTHPKQFKLPSGGFRKHLFCFQNTLMRTNHMMVSKPDLRGLSTKTHTHTHTRTHRIPSGW